MQPVPMHPVIVRLAESPEDLETCLHIRRVVFVDEQGVPESEELDGLDDQCTHFLATAGGEPVGTARLRLVDGKAKAQRVAVLRQSRGAGIGRSLMASLEAVARTRGAREVVLAAQVSAIPFYQRIAYVAEGEEFMDAGIPHRWMKRPLR